MTPEDKEKAIVVGYMLASQPLLPAEQARLEAMTDEEIILRDHELTVIIESNLSTSVSVIAAAHERIRSLSELVRRRALQRLEDQE